MALYLDEDDVRALIGIEDAVAALETAFRQRADTGAVNLPRRRLALPGSVYQTMAAVLPADDVFGSKLYYVLPAGRNFTVLLHSLSEGRLLAMIEADWMSQLRTGAATGLAARHLARADAHRAAIVGAGTQARAQLLALAAVRPLSEVSVFGRTAARREAFAREMSAALGIPVRARDSVAACAEGADLLVTITNAAEPLVEGGMLAPGCFVAGAGANRPDRRELDASVFARAATVVVDDREQATIESGELAAAVEAGALAWEGVAELGDVVAGRAPGRRTDDDIAVFKSLGIALEDIAVARMVHARALEQGRGRPMPGT